jgi:uncharacterized protein YlxP (DUF503 family)
MLLAVGRLVLDFYNNDALAAKHRGLEELCKDLRKKFNVSALEIADFDDPERCVIGFAAVIPETWRDQSAQDFLDKIVKEIDEKSFARISVEDVDLLEFGGG